MFHLSTESLIWFFQSCFPSDLIYGFIFKFSCYDSDYDSDDSTRDSNHENNKINEYLENKYLENDCNAKMNFNQNDKYIILYIQHLKNNKKNILLIKRQELYEQLINIKQPRYWYDTKRTLLPMFEKISVTVGELK